MASAWFYLSFAKPNLIVNTDLLIILCNYFSLIFKAEILFPPQLYLKRFILYRQSLQLPQVFPTLFALLLEHNAINLMKFLAEIFEVKENTYISESSR